MSASQELGWAWEQWTNWYSHQSCHGRFCLEVVWSHSGAKLCQIVRWLQGTKVTITSSATSGLPSDPVGMKAHDRPVIHCALTKKEFMKENESNLLRNPVCKGIPPNPQSRHCPERSDQYFWADSLVLGKHHLLKTNKHWKFIPLYIEFHDDYGVHIFLLVGPGHLPAQRRDKEILQQGADNDSQLNNTC